MGQIPTYTSVVGRPVSQMPLRPLELPSGGEAFARGLMQLGTASAETAQKFQDEEDRRNAIKLRIKAFQDFGEFQNGLANRHDYQNFEPALNQFVGKWQEDNLGENVNQNVYDQVLPQFAEMSVNQLSQVRKTARDSQMSQGIADMQSGLDQLQARFTTEPDPKIRAEIPDMAKELIYHGADSGLIDPEVAQRMWHGQQDFFGKTDVTRAYNEDKGKLLVDLADPNKYPFVIGPAREEIKAKIVNDLEIEARQRAAEIRQQQAIARSDLMSRLPDEAVARAHGDTTGISDAQILSVLGPDLGAQHIESMNRGRNLAVALNDVALMTPEEEKQLQARFHPEGAGYAQEQQQLDDINQAIALKHEQMTKDAAGYVVMHNPAVAQMFATADAGKDPAALQQAIIASLDQQAALGVPRWDQKPLPNDTATNFVANWKLQPDDKSKFNYLMGTIGTVSDTAIRGQLMDQLVAAGLPSDLGYAIDAAKAPPARNTAIDLVAPLSSKTTPALPNSMKESDFKKAVSEVYMSGIGAVYAQQFNATHDAHYQQMMETDIAALTKVAASQANKNDATAPSAAAAAYSDLFSRHMTAGTSDLGRIVVPAGTDRAKLESGMEAGKQNVVNRILANQGAHPLGEGITKYDQWMINSWQNNWADNLRWVNQGEDRFALVDTTVNRLVSLETGPNAKPYIVNSRELVELGTAPAAPPSNYPANLPPLSKIGNPVGTTSEGRVLYRLPDGNVTSEQTITIGVDGKYVNIPTIYDGYKVTDAKAIAKMKAAGFFDAETNRRLPFFDTEAEALKAAEDRSKMLGEVTGQ